MSNNTRLAFLENLLAQGKADSFARYALALEYRRESRLEDALAVFDGLRECDGSYVPSYLMAAQILAELGRNEGAREWATAGQAAALVAGDGKAHSELSSLLGTV